MTTKPPRAAVARALWDRVQARVATLDDADWQRPTPCPGWDVKDLVGHLGGIQRFFDHGGAQPSPPDGWTAPAGMHVRDVWTEAAVAARRDWTPQAVRDELAAATDGHVARLEGTTDWAAPTPGPVGETSEDGLFAVRCFDVWVHLQDLALALASQAGAEAGSRPVDLPDVSAAALVAHRYVLGLLPWLFGKKAGAREGATLRVRLGAPLDHDAVLAVGGGRAGWDPNADAGDCVVEGDPGALTLLLCGRGDPGYWREQGLLDWAGPRGEDLVMRGRLF